MENTEKRIVTIGGIKMEIDMRHAKVIDEYRVGSNIKVLIKDSYGDNFKSYIGTIIGFDEFELTPTIVIAYLKTDYGSATVEFLYFHDKCKSAEICPLNDWDLPVTKTQVLDRFDLEIEKKKKELQEFEQKKILFEKLFGKYFEGELAKAGINLGSPKDEIF